MDTNYMYAYYTYENQYGNGGITAVFTGFYCENG